MRCFVCVVPPASVRRVMDSRLAPLRRSFPLVKWVREDLLHLTLMFLGEVPGGVVEEIAGALAPRVFDMAPFDLSLGAMGAFPGSGVPRVLWVGLEGDLDGLERLARVVRQVAQGISMQKVEQFVPHMTVGRVKRPDPALLPIRDALDATGFKGLGVSFRVEQVVLMESRLGPGGPTYLPIGRYPMGG